MAKDDQELITIFIEEASDLLGSIAKTLQGLGEDFNRLEKINDLKRDLHTLKGSARMVGQAEIGNVAHELETLAEAISKGGLKMDRTIFDLFELSQDRMSMMVESLSQHLPMPSAEEILQSLQHYSGGVSGVKESKTKPREESKTLSDLAQKTSSHAQEFIRIRSQLLEKLNSLSTESTMMRVGLEQYIGNIGLHLLEMKQEIRRLEAQIGSLGSELQSYVAIGQDYYNATQDQFAKTIEYERYNTLEQMSNVIRETTYDIVNVLNTLVESHAHSETLLLNQARVSTELQHRLADTRLVPFDSIVPRLGRIARQVSQELNKQVDFKVTKTEGEMDRNVLEKLIPSLEHILRNAIDHGIESKDTRKKLGKPEIGTIEVSFIRKGSIAAIEIKDDGAGIDVEAVRRKAINIGRIEPNEKVTDDELLRLILEPGFSTREAVTQISGRGVGMDVVNTAVNELGGSLAIESEHDQGTTITIRFPFTASLNRVLMFMMKGQIFGIQLTSVDTVLLISFEELEKYLAMDSPEFKYGEKTYHLHYLGALLGSEKKEVQIPKKKNFPVILFSTKDYLMALIVDSVLYSRELVVQALGAQFKLTNECSGGTLLGDGRVVFILDLYNLSRKAMAITERGKTNVQFLKERGIERTGKALIMVVDDSISVRTVTKRLLERHEYQVITAKDGLDALHQIENVIPDLILLDLDMPRMDGIEFATNLRRDPKYASLPIIVISSRVGSLESSKTKALDLKKFLKKPYQESDLLTSIESIVGKS